MFVQRSWKKTTVIFNSLYKGKVIYFSWATVIWHKVGNSGPVEHSGRFEKGTGRAKLHSDPIGLDLQYYLKLYWWKVWVWSAGSQDQPTKQNWEALYINAQAVFGTAKAISNIFLDFSKDLDSIFLNKLSNSRINMYTMLGDEPAHW